MNASSEKFMHLVSHLFQRSELLMRFLESDLVAISVIHWKDS